MWYPHNANYSMSEDEPFSTNCCFSHKTNFLHPRRHGRIPRTEAGKIGYKFRVTTHFLHQCLAIMQHIYSRHDVSARMNDQLLWIASNRLLA
jgi:hypothetical protein